MSIVLAAHCAHAECVEPVTGELELAQSRCLCKCVVDDSFRLRGDGEIGHLAALDADEVVVMTNEVLVKFVAGVVVAPRDPVHHACVLEIGEISVDGALCELGSMLQKLGNGCGMADIKQRVDQAPSTLGVDELTRSQTMPDLGVNTFV